MQTISINPTEYVTSDPSLKINYKESIAIVGIQTIGLKWISMGLRLPSNIRIEEITICYQIISNQFPPSFITRIQLPGTGASDHGADTSQGDH